MSMNEKEIKEQLQLFINSRTIIEVIEPGVSASHGELKLENDGIHYCLVTHTAWSYINTYRFTYDQIYAISFYNRLWTVKLFRRG